MNIQLTKKKLATDKHSSLLCRNVEKYHDVDNLVELLVAVVVVVDGIFVECRRRFDWISDRLGSGSVDEAVVERPLGGVVEGQLVVAVFEGSGVGALGQAVVNVIQIYFIKNTFPS
jgi:hypothetical protein